MCNGRDLGPDLGYVLQQGRRCLPFGSAFVWSLAQQLFEALEVLRCAGLLHADIKPQNVVLHHRPGAGDDVTRVTLPFHAIALPFQVVT